ncbi:MAG: hypothetical protein PHD09_05405 [Candidatus Omnitrophica bacterium]|nr:hypothetical protein [Candidatus Omnitrophota bacterium]
MKKRTSPKKDPRLKQIRHYIQDENMRVETVASQIGVTARTVYYWMDGKGRISPLASPRVDMFLRQAKRIAQVDAAERAQSLVDGR